MSSDNVQLFTYTTPLGAGAVHTSDYLILGQYISLSILVASDTNTSVTVQFSGDGINNDYSILKSFSAGVGGQESVVVQAKWARLRIQNTSGGAQTYLRLFVYGTPTNSVSIANIAKIGNFNPVVDVLGDGNWPLSTFGEPLTGTYSPASGYNFCYGTSGDVLNPGSGTEFLTKYEKFYDIYPWSNTVLSQVNFVNGVARLTNTRAPLETNYLAGHQLAYPSGSGVRARFTALFNQNSDSSIRMGAGVGNARKNNGVPLYDFVGFGYSSTLGNGELEIFYYRGGVLTQVIPKSAWNLDPCDGTVRLPALDPGLLNIYEVSVAYHGGATFTFALVYNGRSYPVHRITYENSSASSNFRFSTYQILMFTSNVANTGDSSAYVGMGGSSMGFISPYALNNAHVISRVEQATASGGVPLTFLSLRNPSGTFLSQPNYTVGSIYSIKISVDSVGAGTSVLKVFRNSTLSGAIWGSLDDLTPFERDTSGSISVQGYEVLSIPLGSNDSKSIDLEGYLRQETFQYGIPSGTDDCIYTFQVSSTSNTEFRMAYDIGLR